MAILFLFCASCKSRSDHKYPASVAKNFIRECTRTSGGAEKMCTCMFDKIQAKYTLEEFSAIELKMKAGQAPPDFLDFAGKARVECSK